MEGSAPVDTSAAARPVKYKPINKIPEARAFLSTLSIDDYPRAAIETATSNMVSQDAYLVRMADFINFGITKFANFATKEGKVLAVMAYTKLLLEAKKDSEAKRNETASSSATASIAQSASVTASIAAAASSSTSSFASSASTNVAASGNFLACGEGTAGGAAAGSGGKEVCAEPGSSTSSGIKAAPALKRKAMRTTSKQSEYRYCGGTVRSALAMLKMLFVHLGMGDISKTIPILNIMVENRERGHITKKVYWNYLTAMV